MLKKIFKRNSHNFLFKALAGFGRSINRLYENRNHNRQSNGELFVLEKLAQFNPKIIFDGGANIGSYSICINEKIKDCSIYAFEPVLNTFSKLEENLKDYPKVKSIPLGLFSESGKKTIHIYDVDTHSSLYDIQGIDYDVQNTTEIELTTGDEFMRQNNIKEIDLLKLDLEGADYDALVGFQKAFENQSIRMVQFEYGYINITSKKLLIDFYQFFEKHEYIVGKIYPKSVDFRSYQFKHEDFIGPNYLAVKKGDVELIEALR